MPQFYPPGKYEYITINDACNRDAAETGSVNVYGVVKYYSDPVRCASADGWMMDISLVDETCDLGDESSKLFCHLYCRNDSCVPSVSAVGEIVRFHRLKLQKYQGKNQAQTAFGFSNLVFGSGVEDSLIPKTKQRSYTMGNTDEKRIKELRQWCSRNNIPARYSVPSCSISDMRGDSYCDLVCQVIGKCVFREGAVCVQVWDGTAVPDNMDMLTIQLAANESDQLVCDETLVNLATELGLAYDVMVYDRHALTLNDVNPGQFIKFINIHVQQVKDAGNAGKLEMLMHGGGVKYNRRIVLLDETNDKNVIDGIKHRLHQLIEERDARTTPARRKRDARNSQAQGEDVGTSRSVTRSTSKVRKLNPAPQTNGPTSSKATAPSHAAPTQTIGPTSSKATAPSHAAPTQTIGPTSSKATAPSHAAPTQTNGPTSSKATAPSHTAPTQTIGPTSSRAAAGTIEEMQEQGKVTISTVLGDYKPPMMGLADIVSRGSYEQKYRALVQCISIKPDPRKYTYEKFIKLTCHECDSVLHNWYTDGAQARLHKVPSYCDDTVNHYRCSNSKCASNTPGPDGIIAPAIMDYTMLTNLMLRDKHNIQMPVMLARKSFEHFFGITSEDILRDPALFQLLQRRVEKVLGKPKAVPWFECVIVKYESKYNNSAPFYQMVATKLSRVCAVKDTLTA